MKLKYHDKKADTIYIQFNDSEYSYSDEVDEFRFVDYDSSDQPIGVELLGVSTGVVTDGLPNKLEIDRALEGLWSRSNTRKKKEHDFAVTAFKVVQEAVGNAPKATGKKVFDYKALGSKGGLKGGKVRAARLTPERRSEIATKAAQARWDKRG